MFGPEFESVEVEPPTPEFMENLEKKHLANEKDFAEAFAEPNKATGPASVIILIRNDMARIFDLAASFDKPMDLQLCYDIALSRCPQALKILEEQP